MTERYESSVWPEVSREGVLFAAGPLRPNPGAVHGLYNTPGIHYREYKCAELRVRLERGLCELAGYARPWDFFATIALCTGTGMNEAALRMLGADGKPGLLISNGHFGDRLITQAHQCGVQVDTACYGHDAPIIPDEVPWDQRKYGWVFFVAHETRAGIQNPAEALAGEARSRGMLVVCDAMSALFAYPLHPEAFDILITSSAKGIGAYPGLGIALCHREVMANMCGGRRAPLSSYYLNLLGEYRRQSQERLSLFPQPMPQLSHFQSQESSSL